jgi:hypothetical protein
MSNKETEEPEIRQSTIIELIAACNHKRNSDCDRWFSIHWATLLPILNRAIKTFDLDGLRLQVESLTDEQRARVIEGYCSQCGKEGGCWCDYDSELE